jgi:hypothetical protein
MGMLTGLGVVAIGAAAAWAFLGSGSGPGAYLRALFGFVPLHAAGHTHNPWFYVQYLYRDYGALWVAFPLLLASALAYRPAAALFCGLLFMVALIFHSLAAWKHERYLFHALPFFCAVVGMGAAGILVRSGAAFRQPGRTVARLAWGASAVGLLVIAAFSTSGTRMTWKMLTVSDARWDQAFRYRGEPDWQAAAPALRAIADSVEVVVSSNDLKALYYLDRLDYTLSAFNLANTMGTLPEFGISEKTGKPVISAPGSIARVIDEHTTGLVVVEKYDWHQGWGVPGGTGNYISAHTEKVPLDGHWRILAFRWREKGGVAAPAE